MALREKIIEEEEERRRLRNLNKLFSANEEPREALVDAKLRHEREVLEERLVEGLRDEDSERLKRIERMLVEIYKKLGM